MTLQHGNQHQRGPLRPTEVPVLTRWNPEPTPWAIEPEPDPWHLEPQQLIPYRWG